MKTAIKALLTTLVVIPLFGLFLPVRAEEETKSLTNIAVMQVAPIMNELAVKPGDVIKKQLTVKNMARLPLPVKAYSRAFVATDEYDATDYPNEEKNTASVQNWFSFENPDFILQPQETKVVNLTINVPMDARPGGQYATVFVESLIPKEALNETSLYLSSRIGALFFFVVAGDLTEQGQMSDFKTKDFWRTGPVTFDLGFNNGGNVDLTPRSKLTITDWRGNIVEEIIDDGKRTLPGRTRRWGLTFDKKWLFGKYTAKLETKITQDSQSQFKEIQFNAFPVTQAVQILLTIAFIYIVPIKGRHRLKKAYKVLMAKQGEVVADEVTSKPIKKTKEIKPSEPQEAKPVVTKPKKPSIMERVTAYKASRAKKLEEKVVVKSPAKTVVKKQDETVKDKFEKLFDEPKTTTPVKAEIKKPEPVKQEPVAPEKIQPKSKVDEMFDEIMQQVQQKPVQKEVTIKTKTEAEVKQPKVKGPSFGDRLKTITNKIKLPTLPEKKVKEAKEVKKVTVKKTSPEENEPGDIKKIHGYKSKK